MPLGVCKYTILFLAMQKYYDKVYFFIDDKKKIDNFRCYPRCCAMILTYVIVYMLFFLSDIL